MPFSLKEKYEKEVIPVLVKKYSYKSSMQVPKLVKIVINRGIGEAVSNSKVVEYTAEQFAALTGQKPLLTKSKKSISNFKIREGQIIGCKVTLRSRKMYDFLTKLLKVALPKIRDFGKSAMRILMLLNVI
jgi:large subunit ribosomal protein L5